MNMCNASYGKDDMKCSGIKIFKNKRHCSYYKIFFKSYSFHFNFFSEKAESQIEEKQGDFPPTPSLPKCPVELLKQTVSSGPPNWATDAKKEKKYWTSLCCFPSLEAESWITMERLGFELMLIKNTGTTYRSCLATPQKLPLKLGNVGTCTVT